jgi:hypothetical protein
LIVAEPIMPTLKEKYEHIRNVRLHGADQETRNKASEDEYDLSQSPEGLALSLAKTSESDLGAELRKLNQVIDSMQDQADKIRAKLAAARHAVVVLGNVEVP